MKIIISGGGFASLYLSNLLSDEHEVKVFEEHEKIGKYTCCTGLVSKKVIDSLPINPPVVNEIKNVEVVSPSKKVYMVENIEKIYVLDRSKLEEMLRDLCLSSGVDITLNTRILDVNKNSVLYRNKGNLEYEKGEIIIGADGPNSVVREKMNMGKPKGYLIGIQTKIKRRVEEDTIRIYPTNKYSDGLFAWEVPYNDEEIVGLASYTSPLIKFKKFLKDLNVNAKNFCMKPIPIGLVDKLEMENVRLIGDAAGMCKPTSGGGIYPITVAAKILAKNIRGGYENIFIKNLGKDLQKGLILNKIYRKMDDVEREKLLALLEDEEIKDLVRKKGDIDNPLKFGYSLIKKRPSLIKYIPRMFRSYFSL